MEKKMSLRVSLLTAFDPAFKYVDFIESAKIEATSIVLEDFLGQLRTEGVTHEQILRALSVYFEKQEYADDITDKLHDLASEISEEEKNLSALPFKRKTS